MGKTPSEPGSDRAALLDRAARELASVDWLRAAVIAASVARVTPRDHPDFLLNLETAERALYWCRLLNPTRNRRGRPRKRQGLVGRILDGQPRKAGRPMDLRRADAQQDLLLGVEEARAELIRRNPGRRVTDREALGHYVRMTARTTGRRITEEAVRVRGRQLAPRLSEARRLVLNGRTQAGRFRSTK